MNKTNYTSWTMFHNSSNISSQENATFPRCHSLGLQSNAGKTIQTLLYVLIIIGSLFGNCLVITIVLKTTKMKTTVNYFITNMAISDLLVPVLAVPVKIAQAFSGNAWLIGGEFGEFSCKLVPFCVDVSTAVSIQSLVIIALDRYFAVVYPLRKHFLNRRRCLLTMGLTWLLAAFFHSPYFYTFRLFPSGDQLYCRPTWKPAFSDSLKAEERYYFVLFTVLYAAPLLTTCILYAFIAFDLIRKNPNQSHQGNSSNRRRANENRSVICMMVTVVLVFTVCYTPGHICLLLYYNALQSLGCNIEVAFKFSMFMVHVNGALNPVIYFVFSRKYSIAVKNLISKIATSQS